MPAKFDNIAGGGRFHGISALNRKQQLLCPYDPDENDLSFFGELRRIATKFDEIGRNATKCDELRRIATKCDEMRKTDTGLSFFAESHKTARRHKIIGFRVFLLRFGPNGYKSVNN